MMKNRHQQQPTGAEVRQILRQQLPKLADRYGVISLGLFGSFARSEQNKVSDVDLLVEIDNPHMTLLQFIELRNHLSDLLGINVDLVERGTLKPALGRRILQEVELL